MALQDGTPKACGRTTAGTIGNENQPPSREELEGWEVKERNLLRFGPPFLNPYDGYVCIISVRIGHTVEYSHGQVFGRASNRAKSASPVLDRVVRRPWRGCGVFCG